MTASESVKQPKRQIGQPSGKQKMPKRQREESASKKIMIGVIAIVAVVILLIGSGIIFNWYIPKIQPLSKVFMKIDDREYNMRYFMDRLYLSTGSGGGWMAPYFVDQIPGSISRDYFLVEYAKSEDITISDKEVADYIKEKQLRDNEATRDAVHAILVSNYYKDEVIKAEVGESADQREFLAMVVESVKDAEKILEEIREGERTFEDLITTSDNLNSTLKNQNGKITWTSELLLEKLLGSEDAAKLMFGAELGELIMGYDEDISKTRGYWIVQVTEDKGTPGEASYERKISVILAASEEEAEMIREKLAAGEDFAELAKEYSQHSSSDDGGDLGFLTKTATNSDYRDIVFGKTSDKEEEEDIDPMEIGAYSEAVKTTTATTGGVILYIVTSHDNNVALTDKQISDSVDYLMTEKTNKINEDNEDRVDDLFDADMRQYAIDNA